MPLERSLRIGVIMYQTSRSKGQELVAQRMVQEFNRLGHSAYLITSAYHDWKQVVPEDDLANKGGFVHLYDETLGIPIIRVGSETADWPPRRILFRNFVGVLTRIVSDSKLNVLISHSTLWNGPEDATKFVVWNRKMIDEGAHNHPVLLCHMSHFQEASDDRYTVEERTFRETWNRGSLGEILRQADYVLVTTPLEQTQMKALGAVDEKCILFPGGIDERPFDDEGERAGVRRKFGIPSSPKLVTFVGTVEERKNILGILEVAKAFNQASDVHFVIAGRLDGDYAEKVKEAARSATNVTLTGEISDGDKARLIDESYVNLTLSRSEALGIAQLEFMYRGVPVISSGVGGQSWVVRDGANGILLSGPDDIGGATRAVGLLVSDARMRNVLSQGAMKSSSQATLSRLIAVLAVKLSRKLEQVPEVSRLQPGHEKLIEARVQGKRRVTVTTQRLIVSSAKGGKLIVSIPFGQIVRISRLVRRPWMTLLLGVVMSGALFILERLFVTSTSAFISAIQGFPLVGVSALSTGVLSIGLPLIPAIAATALFYRRIKDGFVVDYGEAQKIFLAREFGVALRTVQSLVSGIQGTIDEPDGA